MAFGKGGALRPLLVAWTLAWPASSLAQPQKEAELQLTAQSIAEHNEAPPAFDPRTFEPITFGPLTVGKRGVEYRNSFALRRKALPYRVWGGRSHKQITIGIDFEPVMRRRQLRFGAYGNQGEIGFAMRLRY